MNRAISYRSGSRAIVMAAAIFVGNGAARAGTLFFHDFAGPTMSSEWVASGLPNSSIPSLYPFAVSHAGTPDVHPQSIEGASVLRMSVKLPPLHRVGWTVDRTFSPAAFRYEVRFNTLAQSARKSIDGFIELWILDAANSNRCDVVGLFGSQYSTSRRFMVGSSVDDSYFVPLFSYQSHTWYRLVLEGAPDENIRASLCDDQGNELITQELAHGVRVYSDGFKIGLAQGMGTPFEVAPMDVAIDFAALSGDYNTAAPPIMPHVMNSFADSVPAPSLNISPTPAGVSVQWRGTEDILLESTTNLADPLKWESITNDVTEDAGTFSVPITLEEPVRFFRLRHE